MKPSRLAAALIVAATLLLLAATPAASFWVIGDTVHQDITWEALPFLKTTAVFDRVAKGVNSADLNPDYRHNAYYHFDNCTFSGSVQAINSNYRDVVAALDPANPQLGPAQEQFGLLLHPAQDFYSHSNWIELGRPGLVDGGVGWLDPDQNQAWNETNPQFAGLSSGDTLGLTDPTGLFSLETSPHECNPTNFRTHEELNKDSVGRPHYQAARELAVKQTQHEWPGSLASSERTTDRPALTSYVRSGSRTASKIRRTLGAPRATLASSRTSMDGRRVAFATA